MMSFLVILLCAVACLSPGVRGNYLMASYDAAMEMKEEADGDIEYWRWRLTNEAEDIDSYFLDVIIFGIENANTTAQGAAVGRCAAAAEARGRQNIINMDEVILEAEEASNDLHFTVFGLLRTFNIKEQDPELFYYYHNYVMEEAYGLLLYNYYQMSYAYSDVFNDWFDHFYDLYDCVYEALDYNL